MLLPITNPVRAAAGPPSYEDLRGGGPQWCYCPLHIPHSSVRMGGQNAESSTPERSGLFALALVKP